MPAGVYPTGATIHDPERCWNGYTLYPSSAANVPDKRASQPRAGNDGTSPSRTHSQRSHSFELVSLSPIQVLAQERRSEWISRKSIDVS